MACFAVIAAACFALADDLEVADREEEITASPEAMLADFTGLAEPLAGFDWDEEAKRIRHAAESLWKRNGWTEEADRFACELACELAAIPPWDVAGRLNRLTTRITERYGLSQEAAAQLQISLMREAGWFLMRHGRVILENGRESLTARAKGEPFTSEQVARWAKEGEPLLADMLASADRLGGEIIHKLDPEHKQLFDQDAESLRKRTRFVDAMRTQWAEGKWQPTHWGLESDPIQNRALPPSGVELPAAIPIQTVLPQSPEPAPDLILPKWVSHDPATWFAYVLEFEERFDLDPGQKSTAESIHAELLARAGDYSEIHREELRRIPVQERPTHVGYEPIRAMFTELQARLDALPTSSQRMKDEP